MVAIRRGISIGLPIRSVDRSYSVGFHCVQLNEGPINHKKAGARCARYSDSPDFLYCMAGHDRISMGTLSHGIYYRRTLAIAPVVHSLDPGTVCFYKVEFSKGGM